MISPSISAETSNLRARPDTFSQSQSNYRVLAGGGQAARWAGHIVTVAGRPALVAAMTIVPNINTSLLKGTPNLLVDIKCIDDTFIYEIGRSLLLSDFSLTPKPAQTGAIVSQPFVGDDGTSIGYLNWTTRQPGQVLLNCGSVKRRPGTKRSTMLFPGCRTACTW